MNLLKIVKEYIHANPNSKKISRVFWQILSLKIVLPKLRPHFVPPHCPNTWRAEPQKEKCPFHF